METEIMIVGVCAAGKTTLVEKLKADGFKVTTVSQEHSINPDLWQRARPYFLVVLDCSLETARERRNRNIPPAQFASQKEKLQKAREQCDLYLKTDNLSVEESAGHIIRALQEKKKKGGGRPNVNFKRHQG